MMILAILLANSFLSKSFTMSLTQLRPFACGENSHHERRKKVSSGLTNTCSAAEKTAMDATVALSKMLGVNISWLLNMLIHHCHSFSL